MTEHRWSPAPRQAMLIAAGLIASMAPCFVEASETENVAGPGFNPTAIRRIREVLAERRR